MRDAITLLDKCLAYNINLTVENVTKALDFVDMIVMYDLTDYLYKRDVKSIIELTEKIYRDGTDIKLFSKQFLSYTLNVIKFNATNNANLTNLPNSIIDLLVDTKRAAKEDNFYISLLEWLLKLNELIKWETSPKALFQANLISFIS